VHKRAETRGSRSAVRARKAAQPAVVGVRITHAERVVYPDANVTKLMVADYYARVGERMLPYVAGRPLSVMRCPDGLNAPCFFQKHLARYAVPGVGIVMIDESTGRNPYPVAESVEALVGMAQWNVLELHAWSSSARALDRPDTLVLDLDPDPALPWAALVQAARDTRALLESLDMVSFVKTTGGKGLHVVVPLERRSSWDEAKAFARGVALHMAEAWPERFTATSGEENRRRKIFVDYLRNARGATAVVPYSLRARPGARVATPLSWSELSAKTTPAEFTIATVPDRVRRGKDPWADYAKSAQRLTAKALRAVRGR